MINIVIPMAGLGSRFSKADYKLPKPFIDVLGKPMIARVMENLSVSDAHYTLIARKEHIAEFPECFEDLEKNYPVTIIGIDKVTAGPACTVLHAHRAINNDTPILIANSDQLVDMDFSDMIKDSRTRKLMGSILTFPATDPKWSFAKVDADGYLLEAKEKVPISDQATVGIYYFERGRDFVEGALDMIAANDTTNNEFYVVPIYNYLVKLGQKFGIYSISEDVMHGLGTPDDLNDYLALKS